MIDRSVIFRLHFGSARAFSARSALAATALTVAVTVSAPAAVGTPASPAPRPSLRPVDVQPIALAGAGFRPSEAVRVTLFEPRRSVRWTRASTAGRFTVQFPRIAFDRCSGGLVATAVGTKGSRAAAKIPPLMCPPRLLPPSP